MKPYFTNYIENIITNFEKIYGIDVEWQDYPLDSIYQKILSSYGTNLSPDVINVNPQLASGLYKQNIVVDISIYDGDIQSNFYSNLVEGCRINQKLITIPWYSSTKMLVYNKKIFDFSRIRMKDYRDFLEVVKRIKKEKGVYGFYPFLKFEQDMLGLGLINDPRYPFNDQVVEFFEQLRKNKEYLPSGFWVSSVEFAYSMYKEGKVASILIGPQFLYRIKKEDPELYKNTSVMLFPFKEYPVTVMSLSIVNNKNLERIKKSIIFIKYLTNFYNQNEFFKIVPIVPSVIGNYTVEDSDPLIKQVKQEMLKIFDKSKVFDLYFYSYIPDPLVRTNIIKNFLNEVFSTNKSIADIQMRYQKLWNNSTR
ncbi:MAG: extracellular solute-binding protein [bacterium]